MKTTLPQNKTHRRRTTFTNIRDTRTSISTLKMYPFNSEFVRPFEYALFFSTNFLANISNPFHNNSRLLTILIVLFYFFRFPLRLICRSKNYWTTWYNLLGRICRSCARCSCGYACSPSLPPAIKVWKDIFPKTLLRLLEVLWSSSKKGRPLMPPCLPFCAGKTRTYNVSNDFSITFNLTNWKPTCIVHIRFTKSWKVHYTSVKTRFCKRSNKSEF